VKIPALVCALFCLFMATKSADAQDLADLRHRLTKQFLGYMVLVAPKRAVSVMAQPAAGRKRLTVVCSWQNFAEVELGRLSANYLLNGGAKSTKTLHVAREPPQRC
jgi:hypothetical protein